MIMVKDVLVGNVLVIYVRSLHETGVALPIFARKRPRVALMASNSQSSGPSSERVAQHYKQDKRFKVTTTGDDKENASNYSHNRGREITPWR